MNKYRDYKPKYKKFLQGGDLDPLRPAVYSGANMAMPGLGTALQAGDALGNMIAPVDENGVQQGTDLTNTISNILDPIGRIEDLLNPDLNLNFGQKMATGLGYSKFANDAKQKLVDEEVQNRLPNPTQLGELANGGPLNKYNTGGTHEQNPNGGIPIQGHGASVEEGETSFEDFVYSDRLKIDKVLAKEFNLPKKYINKTFADASKGMEKQNPRDYDALDVESKSRMLDRLANAQESFKSYKFDKDFESMMMKYGGKLKKMAEGGPMTREEFILASGLNPDLDEVNAAYQQYYDNFYNNQKITSLGAGNIPGVNPTPTLAPIGGQTIIPTQAGPMANGYVFPEETMGELLKKYTPGQSSDNPDPYPTKQMSTVELNPYAEAARYVPMMANFVSGLKHDRLNADDYSVNSRVQAPSYNIDPLLDSNNRGYNRMLESIRGGAGRNAGAYLSNLGVAQVNKQKADAEAIYQKENMDAQNQFQADQFNIGIEQANLKNKFLVDDWNMKSKESGKDLQRAAASNLGAIGDAKINEAYQRALINAMSDNFGFDFKYKWKKNGGYFY